jgi:16S rRNA G966 N2-methylase RsmD
LTTVPLFALDEHPDEAPHDGSGKAISRAGGIYGGHAYHTKVPPEAIEPYLLRYSQPGDLVLDPFAGSGMTGVAAARVARRAWLSDLSPAAVHIARNYTTPCPSAAYQRAAEAVLDRCRGIHDRLYGSYCHVCGGRARVAYVIWSDVRACPQCSTEHRIWDYRNAGLRRLTCSACRADFAKHRGLLVREEPVRVNLRCGSCGRVERDPLPDDISAATLVRSQIDTWFPSVPFDDRREMWRKGHEELGIGEVADFYTPRNLWALGHVWRAIEVERGERMRDALRFTFTAIANRASKRYQWNAKRPTNVLGGTLYIASLRYEFNVFDLWTRKLTAVKRLFEATASFTGDVAVHQSSAVGLPLPAASVDYCFTDPPFGANIVYSDCSLLWEAWLGQLTDCSAEAVVTHHRKAEDGGKDVDGYGQLMAAAFGEIARVLKPGRHATLVFQNTDPVVWEAILASLASAGLAVTDATTLHKAQPSFKGVKAQQEGERVAATDVVLTMQHLSSVSHSHRSAASARSVIDAALRAELRRLADSGGRQRSVGHLYAVALATAISYHLPVADVSFRGIERWLAEHCEFQDGWRLRSDEIVREDDAHVV